MNARQLHPPHAVVFTLLRVCGCKPSAGRVSVCRYVQPENTLLVPQMKEFHEDDQTLMTILTLATSTCSVRSVFAVMLQLLLWLPGLGDVV